MGCFDKKVEPVYLGADIEKTVIIKEKEYKELLIIKGKYEVMVLFYNNFLALFTSNEIKNLISKRECHDNKK